MPGTRLRRGFDGLFWYQAAVALAKAARPGMTAEDIAALADPDRFVKAVRSLQGNHANDLAR
jgi:hypothetical protein